MKTNNDENKTDPKNLEMNQPPILGSWANIYLMVLGVLGGLIVLFTLFTRFFS